MTDDPSIWMDGYLDETLSPEEHAAFVEWLKASEANRRRFRDAALLHDTIRGALLATKVDSMAVGHRSTQPYPRRWPLLVRRWGWLAIGAVVLLAVGLLWYGPGQRSAAASTEIDRLIAANVGNQDRTYRILVESIGLPKRKGAEKTAEESRPPKPPLDDAILHVRAGGQFVLVRRTRDGKPFVTGCNGRESWAVRPDGPVRVSSDLTRFNHDVPGHEHEMPLIHLHEGLLRLRTAYDIQVLEKAGIESEGTDLERTSETPEPRRKLLIATKKRGMRGPRRVEIDYDADNGRIVEMRFVEMPYGPERLDVRLSLIDEVDLGAAFFDHTTHHEGQRTVEREE